MNVDEAIRKRRAVRNYTDAPVPEDVLDSVLRLALAAPTGSGAQAWSLLVIRDAEKRRALADLVIAGAGRYFALMRPRKEDERTRSTPPGDATTRTRSSRATTTCRYGCSRSSFRAAPTPPAWRREDTPTTSSPWRSPPRT